MIAVRVLIVRMRLPESPKWIEARTEFIAINGTASISTMGDLVRSQFRWPLIQTALVYTLINVALNTNGQFSAYLWVNAARSTVQVQSSWTLVAFVAVIAGTTILLRVMDTKWPKPAFIVSSVVNIASFAVPAIPFGHDRSIPRYIAFAPMSFYWRTSDGPFRA